MSRRFIQKLVSVTFSENSNITKFSSNVSNSFKQTLMSKTTEYSSLSKSKKINPIKVYRFHERRFSTSSFASSERIEMTKAASERNLVDPVCYLSFVVCFIVLNANMIYRQKTENK